MAWLDALRGIAALVVVFDHASYSYLADFQRELMPEFNTSRYGIMGFFLVSGYIIPASLERRGCVRRFWVGRLFRIHPLWALVVTALLAADLAGVAQVRDFGSQGVLSAAVAHVTLLQELLGTPNLLLVLWTLSYEMAFYLLVVALFRVRLHRRSVGVSVALAVLAALSVVAGVTLPPSALSGALGTGRLIALASCAMAVAICCACAKSPALSLFGAVLGGVLALRRGASTAAGAVAIQANGSGDANQDWLLSWRSDTVFQMKNRKSGLCLGISGASTANGAQAAPFPCDGSANLGWAFTE
ncbi:acyltransferase family protein [Streptomyces cellulosae]